MADSTSTGIVVGKCGVCGKAHPLSRKHCPGCGLASLFGHQACGQPRPMSPSWIDVFKEVSDG